MDQERTAASKDISATDASEREKRWQKLYEPRMKQIVPGLFLGNVRSSFKTALLRENHIAAIGSLIECRHGAWGNIKSAGIPEHRHKWIQCADSSTQDLLVYMSDACDFIEQTASSVLRDSSRLPPEVGVEQIKKSPDGEPQDTRVDSVLVHCQLGISRSPTIIIAYLMRKYKISFAEAIAFVRTKQKIKPSANFTRQLQIWGDLSYQIWDDSEKTMPKPQYQAYLDDRAALLKSKGLTGNEPLAPQSL